MDSNQIVITQNTIDSGNNDSSSKNSGKYKKVIEKVLNCTNDHLLVLMNQMLCSADEKLFDHAEKAKTDEERMQYMDCTRIFRTERNDISHHFFINLNTALSTSQTAALGTDAAG